jgi:LacI family transcriptional regulator
VPFSRRVTLTDVAERAGVSTTTASYILNGRSAQMRISAEAERRVRDAVAALDYRPNRNARSLRTATTSTIGLITDYVASGMFASGMLSGANAAARAANHLLVIGETEGDAAIGDLLVDEMRERQVDGILYATRTTVRTALPKRMRGARVVMLNCHDPALGVPAVLPDEVSGGRIAAESLLAAGIDHGIFVVGEDPDRGAVAGPLRLAGIRDCLGERDIRLAGVISCAWGVEPAYDAVAAWLRRGNRPEALVCLNDRIAMGTYQALEGAGLDVPGEVSVVSFDGSDLASWLRPRLTSVAIPFPAMGVLGVELLLDPVRAGSSTHLVPMPLVAGDSIRSSSLKTNGLPLGPGESRL